MSVYARIPGHCPNGENSDLTNPSFFCQGTNNIEYLKLFSTGLFTEESVVARLVDMS